MAKKKAVKKATRKKGTKKAATKKATKKKATKEKGRKKPPVPRKVPLPAWAQILQASDDALRQSAQEKFWGSLESSRDLRARARAARRLLDVLEGSEDLTVIDELWLTSTLAGLITASDKRELNYLLDVFRSEKEGKWRRFWILATIFKRERSCLPQFVKAARGVADLLVRNLGAAIEAYDGSSDALDDLRQQLRSDDTPAHWTTLRALRVVPLPALLAEVERLEDRRFGEEVARYAQRARERLTAFRESRPADVFLSYRMLDREFAKMLAGVLEQGGRSVTWDLDIGVGDHIFDSLEPALATAKSIVVLWSPRSVVSPFVCHEARVAMATGRFCPVKIDKELAEVPKEFAGILYGDLSDWQGDPTHSGYQQLLEAIERAKKSGTALEPGDPKLRYSDTPEPTPKPTPEPTHNDPAAPSARGLPPEIVVVREQYFGTDASTGDELPQLVLRVHRETVELEFGRETYQSKRRKVQDELLEVQTGDPKRYGELLFESIINDDGEGLGRSGSTLDGFRRARPSANERVIVELKLSDPKLYSLYWERMRGPNGRPLAASTRTPLFRRVNERVLPPVEPPVDILVAVCNPTGIEDLGLHKLDVQLERKLLEDGLANLKKRGLGRYDILDDGDGQKVTLERIKDALQKGQGRHVLHLVAHGFYKKHPGTGQKDFYLAIAGDGKYPMVKAADFAHMLTECQHTVRLTILAACQSGAYSEDRTRGPAIGTLLVNEGVPAVISMQEPFGIKSSQVFNQKFYAHLVRSGRIDIALAATRQDLLLDKVDEGDGWSIPVLHLGMKDGRLLQLNPDHELKAARLPEKVTFRQEDLSTNGGEQGGEQSGHPHPFSGSGTFDSIGGAGKPLTPLLIRQELGELTRDLQPGALIRPELLAEHVKHQTGMTLTEEVVRQIATALNTGKHIILIGPPGTGKTTLAHAVCTYAESLRLCRGYVPTTATADWTTFDTVGGRVPVDGNRLDFRPGAFLEAIRTGKWLVIDEINRAEIDKAIGELFTLLAGQRVDLDVRADGVPLRLLPAASGEGDMGWIPDPPPGAHDYVVHPNWRILATMNVYDRSSLFSLSFAFMRRFSFIEVGIPSEDAYPRLCEDWVIRWRAELFGNHSEAGADEHQDLLIGRLRELLDQNESTGNTLMRLRALGPAITLEMIEYVATAAKTSTDSQPDDKELMEFLGEAFQLLALPQLDGLNRESIIEVYRYVVLTCFRGFDKPQKAIGERIRDLYPYVPLEEWPPMQTPAAAEA